MTKSDIENIKTNYSIIDVAKRLGFSIDKNNRTICPFHNDTNPSLSFNVKYNYYHCFSCGASGDNIKLVMNILNYDFKNAIKFISGNDYKPIYKSSIEKKTISYNNIYKEFIDLLNNEEAIEYLGKRMIKKEQIINYSIKNLPKDKTSQYLIIKKLLKNYDENDLIKSGIVVKSKEYNNLYLFHHKHRLIIPYFDIDGSTILSIQGRAIDEEIKPKYLFNKNSKDSIYNIHTLGNIRDIIICEGVIDALSLERLGYNAIALSGVTKINLLKQYEILNKYNLYSFSDNDNAGKKLIEKIYKLDNYKGAFLISNFTTNDNIKDINDLLSNSIIKSFKIQGIIYNYFEIPNDKICILDYYIFNKNELKYIKKEKNFNKALLSLTIDKKTLSEKEYNLKYGELN